MNVDINEELIARVLAARDSNEVCDCDSPYNPAPKAIVCQTCWKYSRALEVRAVRNLCAPHDFTPSTLPGWCDTCTSGRDDPRHHGIAITGALRDGTLVPQTGGVS